MFSLLTGGLTSSSDQATWGFVARFTTVVIGIIFQGLPVVFVAGLGFVVALLSIMYQGLAVGIPVVFLIVVGSSMTSSVFSSMVLS
jgi:hypothetical protein